MTKNPEIDLALTTLIKIRWGDCAEIKSYVPLSLRTSTVARVRISDGVHVIAKHLNPGDFGDDAWTPRIAEFREEQLVHRFLHDIGLERGLKPELLAWDVRGITIFEDLGDENYREQRTFGQLIPMLATALARLHGGTRDLDGVYSRMRKEAYGEQTASDIRRYSSLAHSSRFAAAKKMLVDRIAKEQSHRDAANLEEDLEAVASRIENPSRFLSLIHDDLGNARQTFEVGEDLYLLDFEYAKFSHCLLDLCKPMIGKFEVDLSDGTYGWRNPNFPMKLAEVYRERMDSLFSVTFGDAEWNDSLSSALTYGALALIGRLLCLEPEVQLIGSVAQNTNGILLRLSDLLMELRRLPSLRDAISTILSIEALVPEGYNLLSEPAGI